MVEVVIDDGGVSNAPEPVVDKGVGGPLSARDMRDNLVGLDGEELRLQLVVDYVAEQALMLVKGILVGVGSVEGLVEADKKKLPNLAID